MQLTEHFTLEEMIATEHRRIDNTPSLEIIEKLKYTARGMEHVRLILGVPVIVNSGYRCPQLNDVVGGSTLSQHVLGEACDFIAPAYGSPFAICRAIEASDLSSADRSHMVFDQLIYEGSWVHISFVAGREPRRSVLTWKKGSSYQPGLHE